MHGLENKKKIAFHTLGCKLNFSETASLSRSMDDSFLAVQKEDENLDYFVLNTCSVTNNANRESRQIIRKIKKQNPQAKIVVTGCYAQLKPDEIAAMPDVDLVLGANEKYNLSAHISHLQEEKNNKIHSCDIEEIVGFHAAFSIEERTRTFLKVQDGCDYNCSFCTIPLARGHSRSDSISGVLQNIEELANRNIKEIILTGVNLGDFGKGFYGNKKHEENFLDLCLAIEKQNAIPRFRISSIEPNLLSNDIIDFVAQSKIFMPHFHIPLQSGSNEILGKMKRRYRRELYIERVERIKSKIPHAAIGVDVIVGFPGESQSHFDETYHFLNNLELSYLHVFTYSERENTLAAEMAQVVPNEIRQDRNQILRNLSDVKMSIFRTKHLGETRKVLWEKQAKNNFMEGYSDNYIRLQNAYDAKKVNNICNEIIA